MTTTMSKPKAEVYTALSALGYSCSQGSQQVFNEVPAITFRVGNNTPSYTLDNEISNSTVEMIVDIWANESTTSSVVAEKVESAMRQIGYLLTYSADVPTPEGCLYHIQTRFEAVNK